MHVSLKVYGTHCVTATCFGQSFGHIQGAALQRIDKSKCYRSFETLHRYKILNFKTNAWFKMYNKD